MYTVSGYAKSPVSWYLPFCSEEDTVNDVSVDRRGEGSLIK